MNEVVVRLPGRRKKKKSQHNAVETLPRNGLHLGSIEPLTDTQDIAFESWDVGQNLFMIGSAGTGKSFIAMYLALKELETTKQYKKVVVFRSAVPSREIGFLPGNEKEKAAPYEVPYKAICSELYTRDDAYGVLKNWGMIDFMMTSFIRSLTLNDCIIIIDEVQNFTFQEFSSVLTRAGNNTRIVICGDYKQTDLSKPWDQSGIAKIDNILRKMPSFKPIVFGVNDIVRSGVVKEFILACEENDQQF